MTGWLDEDRARALADGGAISAADRWFAAGAAACVAHLPRAGRSAAIRGAIGRLAAEDPETALHALAALLRSERDAVAHAAQPDCTGDRPTQDVDPVALSLQDMDRLRAELQRAGMKAIEAADLLVGMVVTLERLAADVGAVQEKIARTAAPFGGEAP